jgi:hypothetical protein
LMIWDLEFVEDPDRIAPRKQRERDKDGKGTTHSATQCQENMPLHSPPSPNPSFFLLHCFLLHC